MKIYARSLMLGATLCSVGTYADSVSENAPSLDAIRPATFTTILVTSLKDEVSNNKGKKSLRDAINFANQNPDQNIIIQMRPGIYYLTLTGSSEDRNLTGDLDIANRTGKLTILSPPKRAVQNNPDNKPLVTIDATELGDRILDIFGGDINLVGLKLTGGSQVYGGGAIVNRGNLTIKDTVISGNSATIGGGIDNDIESAKLVVYTSKISENSAEYRGGGIYNVGTVEANSSSISENKAETDGGGLFQTASSSSTISDSKIEKNYAGFSGGGIVSEILPNQQSNLKVLKSSIINNTAGVLGGGIATGGQLFVKDSIISQNSTGNRGGGGLFIGETAEIINTIISNNFIQFTGIQFYGGGGIHLGEKGNLKLKDSTISNNSSVSAGGGVFTYGGTMKIINSNISFNQAKVDDGGGIYVNPRFGPGILVIAKAISNKDFT